MNIHNLILIKHDVIALTATIEEGLGNLSEERQAQWLKAIEILNRSLETIGNLQSDNEALSNQLRKKSLSLGQLEVEYERMRIEFNQLKELL